jgi:N-acetylneuraminic acid mutarotase
MLISGCLAVFAAAQTPAAAAAARSPQTVVHQPAATAAPQVPPAAAPAKPAPRDPDDKPAGCFTATPKPGRASCFAWVRTSDDRRMSGQDGPPSAALTPADIRSAYRLPATGQGQTVAIVDAFGYAAAEDDLGTFRDQYGLGPCTAANGCFRKVDQRGGADYPADDAGWALETALDVDAVSSACPACRILLVEADSDSTRDLGAAVDTAVALGATFVSNSYGAQDARAAGKVNDADYDHPGVVITASTGDVGNAVEWPSSNPHVTAVGGTTLTAAPGTSRGWTETAWSDAGSGCSSFEPPSVYQSVLATDCANRATADISADADPHTGLAVYNSLNGGWLQAGGTSLASPLIAAMYALAGTPAAGTYPADYPYIHAAGDLFDVTAGSNGTCADVLCTAGPGWDGPTGLGTPNGVTALTVGAQGTVSGKVTDRTSGAPMAGAPVMLTDATGDLTFRAVTDSAGTYRASVSAGTYDLSVSVFGYGKGVADGLMVTVGRNTTTDVALTRTPEHTVAGKITDSGHKWPLYAKITVPGDPRTPVYTDPRTGAYTLPLPEGDAYTMTVTPLYPGYAPHATTFTLGTHDLHRDLSVAPDTALCTAPGYGYSAQADFTGWTTAPKYGWTVTTAGTPDTGWRFDNPGGLGNLTGTTGGFAAVDPQSTGQAADTSLTSPVFDLTGRRSADLRFDAAAVLAAGSESDVSVTTDGGRTWQQVYRADGTPGMAGPVDVPLTPALGHRAVQVRFHVKGQGDTYVQLSHVSVGRCQALDGGLVMGAVSDANTHRPVDGATVTDTSAPVTDAYATAVSATDAGNPHLPGGFYWVYSPKSGPNSLTTTAPRYATVRTAVTASASVHTYSPVLRAGRLTVTPARVTLKSALGGGAGQDVTLTNTGTAPVKVTVGEQSLASPATTTPATDPAGSASSWQSLPAYPELVVNSVVGSYEGRTYSVGGASTLFVGMLGQAGLVKHDYVYDPAVGSWQQFADLPQLRTGATGAFLNGTLYVVGGMDYPGGRIGAFEATTYAYHPDSDTWTRAADLPQAVSFANAAVFGGQLYVIGGQTSSGGSAASYRYDPAANTWTRVADYPVPVNSGGCGGVVDGIVCAGGETPNGLAFDTLADTYVYRPDANAWTRAADMPYTSYLGSYSSANGELQVAGGAGGQTGRTLQYDPVADVWTPLPDAPLAAYGAGRGTGCALSLVGGSVYGAPAAGTTGFRTLTGFDQCGGDDVSWLSESRTTVTLAPGQSVRVRITADTGALPAPGAYAASLTLTTDAPYLNSPVPVGLTVTARHGSATKPGAARSAR